MNAKIEEKIAAGETFYVSITGLELKNWWSVIGFWRYAIPSFRQAQMAEGNLYTGVNNIDGVRHTLTVWESKKAMLAFVWSGVHKKAIGKFDRIATGKTLGYEASSVPNLSLIHI